MIAVCLSHRACDAATLVGGNDLEQALQQPDDLVPTGLAGSNVGQRPQRPHVVPVDRNERLIVLRGGVRLGELVKRRVRSLSQEGNPPAAIGLGFRPCTKRGHEIGGATLRTDQRDELLVGLDRLRIEPHRLSQLTLGAGRVLEMLSMPTGRSQTKLVELAAIEVAMRGDVR